MNSEGQINIDFNSALQQGELVRDCAVAIEDFHVPVPILEIYSQEIGET